MTNKPIVGKLYAFTNSFLDNMVTELNMCAWITPKNQAGNGYHKNTSAVNWLFMSHCATKTPINEPIIDTGSNINIVDEDGLQRKVPSWNDSTHKETITETYVGSGKPLSSDKSIALKLLLCA